MRVTATARPTLPAEAQAASFETRRKLNLVLEWLDMQAKMRLQAQAYGRVQIELIFEKGKITRAKLIDELTISDLTDKERELVLRDEAGKPGS